MPPQKYEQETVTLHRLRFGSDDWWQFYDDGSTSHQVCRMLFDGQPGCIDGHDVWVHDGYVEVPSSANDEEKFNCYAGYIAEIIQED
jgi:hypothetical protein